jgi:RecB family endonuclease NucS
MNSGALKTPRGKFIKFGATGMADIYAIGPEGKSIWIECKRPRGGVVSAAQRGFLDCINRHGGIGIVVTSVESLEQQLNEAGVI